MCSCVASGRNKQTQHELCVTSSSTSTIRKSELEDRVTDVRSLRFKHSLKAKYLQPAPGQIWSRSLGSVRFQILEIWCLSSSLASSILPSVLMDNEVRTSANRVALKLTDPSEFNGIFIETKRWNVKESKLKNVLWLAYLNLEVEK